MCVDNTFTLGSCLHNMVYSTFDGVNFPPHYRVYLHFEITEYFCYIVIIVSNSNTQHVYEIVKIYKYKCCWSKVNSFRKI